MKMITLKNSTEIVALVDDEDYERLGHLRWLVSSKGYIVRYEGPSNARIQYRLHNEVLNLPSNSGVDHVNGVKCDNQKSNLRVVTASVNCHNRRTGRSTKGVRYDASRYGKKWKATICKDGYNKTLGYFLTEEEALTAYDKAAVELYGEQALTNLKLREEGY